mmetsp:Transcript_11825/g.34839  ORF Transcript_11825/g.34839 Transcript_11825/m.34839 type:complete len:196 (-) Transcript_11825:17-604(-)
MKRSLHSRHRREADPISYSDFSCTVVAALVLEETLAHAEALAEICADGPAWLAADRQEAHPQQPREGVVEPACDPSRSTVPSALRALVVGQIELRHHARQSGEAGGQESAAAWAAVQRETFLALGPALGGGPQPGQATGPADSASGEPVCLEEYYRSILRATLRGECGGGADDALVDKAVRKSQCPADASPVRTC